MDKLLFDDDYILVDGSGWFKVKAFAIRIHQTDEGIICDIYKDGDEMNNILASCYVFDNEIIEEEV